MLRFITDWHPSIALLHRGNAEGEIGAEQQCNRRAVRSQTQPIIVLLAGIDDENESVYIQKWKISHDVRILVLHSPTNKSSLNHQPEVAIGWLRGSSSSTWTSWYSTKTFLPTALKGCSLSLKDIMCLSETRYPTFQRRNIFASVTSLRLCKDTKDAQKRTRRFLDVVVYGIWIIYYPSCTPPFNTLTTFYE